MEFQNRTAVITGAASGIGLGLAEAAAEETDEIEASASPRKPRVAIRSRSSGAITLLVACGATARMPSQMEVPPGTDALPEVPCQATVKPPH